MSGRSLRLPVLAGVLATGAAIKLALGLGGALAQMPGPPAPVPAPTLAAALPEPAPPARGTVPPGVSPDVLIELRQRELALAERDEALGRRERELEALGTRLAAQLAELHQAEAALRATMALADQAAEADLQRLTGVFEAMRPEQAAAVIAEMDPAFAAGLIGRLAPATTAAIFAGLEPRQAYGLSAILAGRNAEVPRR